MKHTQGIKIPIILIPIIRLERDWPGRTYKVLTKQFPFRSAYSRTFNKVKDKFFQTYVLLLLIILLLLLLLYGFLMIALCDIIIIICFSNDCTLSLSI